LNTIIVLDDDKQFCDLIKIVLEMEGYQTAVAHAPEEMMPLARELDPALVLMDVHVANTETFELLREFRTDMTLRDVPVVMTSGIDYGAECREQGAAAFLFKPFRPTELLNTIAGLIDGQDKGTVHDKKKEKEQT